MEIKFVQEDSKVKKSKKFCAGRAASVSIVPPLFGSHIYYCVNLKKKCVFAEKVWIFLQTDLFVPNGTLGFKIVAGVGFCSAESGLIV